MYLIYYASTCHTIFSKYATHYYYHASRDLYKGIIQGGPKEKEFSLQKVAVFFSHVNLPRGIQVCNACLRKSYLFVLVKNKNGRLS